MLTVADEIPGALLTASATDLHEVLPGPTLVRIAGDRDPPLFLSCLIHGNEHTGLSVLQALLSRYGSRRWPRSAYVFVGNVQAARHGCRHLDLQPDFNRIWSDGEAPEHFMAQQVLATVKREGLFAAVDMHNNTGRNPFYSVITHLDTAHLNLAALFGNLSLYFQDGLCTCTDAMSALCPAVAIEAGKPGDPAGARVTQAFIETLLQLDTLATIPIDTSSRLEVLRHVAIVRIPEAATMGTGADEADFIFEERADRLNFQHLPPGTVIARHSGRYELSVTDAQGCEVGDAYFDYGDGLVRTKQTLLPAMLTLDLRVAKSDCLCHLAQPLRP